MVGKRLTSPSSVSGNVVISKLVFIYTHQYSSGLQFLALQLPVCGCTVTSSMTITVTADSKFAACASSTIPVELLDTQVMLI